MIVIGLTGGSGTGKSTALSVWSEFGVETIDCDALYYAEFARNKEMREAIALRFPSVVTGQSLDRKALGRIVFEDLAALEALSQITHPYVKVAVQKQLEDYLEKGVTAVAVEAIALVESGIHELCETIVFIKAEEAARIKRIVLREGVTEAYAKSRVKSQKADAWFAGVCDVIIENAARESFTKACRDWIQELLQRSE